MKIEVLFSEVCNLCGDLMNIRYLQQCCPSIEVVETDLKSRPKFLNEEIDLVYMGCAPEKGLQLAAAALMPLKDEITAKIDGGQKMLVTGNALDVFGTAIDSDDGLHIDGLGLLPTHAKYQMMKRHNSFFIGTFDADGKTMDIVGFKSLFGHTYDAPAGNALFQMKRGMGRNPETAEEGFVRGGLMATYLTGPLLVLNPPFTKWLLRQFDLPDTLAFEKESMEAYDIRVAEFSEEDRPAFY